MTIEIGRFSEAPGTIPEEPASTAADEQKAPGLVYGSAEEFLHEQLLPTYVRDVDGRAAKWCIEWYFHPEARLPDRSTLASMGTLQTRRSHRHQRLVQRPRRPPHERAPRPARTVLQMRHAKTPRSRTPGAKKGPERLVPRRAWRKNASYLAILFPVGVAVSSVLLPCISSPSTLGEPHLWLRYSPHRGAETWPDVPVILITDICPKLHPWLLVSTSGSGCRLASS